MSFSLLLIALALLVSGAGSAVAEADGPDAWRVVGVRPDDTLNMHADASARSRTILKIPHDATGLANRGCKGGPTFAQWQAMTAAERERSARARWCRVSYQGKTGWVAGRFLAEAAPRAQETASVSVGAWRVSCREGQCAMEQTGVAAQRPTRLKLEPQPDGNARVSIERAGLPRTGLMAIYMDGDEISKGPLAPLRKGPNLLVMEPDDITLGLLRQMARHKNMVITLPGEERGVEFHVEDFGAAMRELDKMRTGRR